MNPRTLIDILDYRARATPHQTAFTFEGAAWTFQMLWDEVNRAASYLHKLNLGSGEHVLLAMPNGHEFFAAFYGIQRCGGVAVPIFPKFSAKHMVHLANLSDSRIIILPAADSALTAAVRSAAEGQGILVTTLASASGAADRPAFPAIQPDSTAFLQYTSGSTGDPKGVQLSHDNLITNAWQLIDGMEITSDEVFVSWLPVYHDMGLILKTIVPFLLGATLHLLPTSLTDVTRWLKTIQDVRGTFTAAPDFAYRLCLRYIQNPRDYDLSSLRVALNAAEPVRLTTIQEFERAFDLHQVMTAGYGLAEATVGVSMSRPHAPIRSNERGLVSVGKPFRDVEVKIAPDGEILIRSAANCQGYYKNPQATEALFRDDGFFHSGDLGLLDDEGYLYIVGRKKNTIIQGGRTIAPQEVEAVVDQQRGVRFSAAVGIDRGRLEGEQVYVFAEMRDDDRIDFDEAVISMVDALHQTLGFRPAHVYLLKPRAIPLTYKGKIQHTRLRELYLSGALFEQDLVYA